MQREASVCTVVFDTVELRSIDRRSMRLETGASESRGANSWSPSFHHLYLEITSIFISSNRL